MKLLLIEDESALSQSMANYLTKAGYHCETAMDFESAQEKTLLYSYDCIIVDLTLPGGNGLDIIGKLKQVNSTVGIIIVSAKNALEDRLKGLELGADDYLTKPFHLSELNARIHSILRRRLQGGSTKISFQEITILPQQGQALVNNEPLILTRSEYDLLLFFIYNKERIITKESVAEHLLGDSADQIDSFDFIYSHVKNLRRKIVEKGGKDYIQSRYGVGYKFSTS
ncbi:response regulator transcription factor [Xanthocytophaga flava]|uniref:response regulator transcription factor n=1 Tax=Xanthocytophaga flava TaxID=3048013 RepID=UPI0028D70133|nr:response regulator transcription factor [Xanthocytophaga flavus]MDJ1470313.1 response regulator transcription factor [Xanthocytophaga flavus]